MSAARTCTACVKTIDLSGFYTSKGVPDSKCKDCRNAAAKVRRNAANAASGRPHPVRKMSPNRQIILDLAARADGCNREEAASATCNTLRSAKNLMFDMLCAGQLFRPTGKQRSQRLFASQALADAYDPKRKRPAYEPVPVEQHKKRGPKPGTPRPARVVDAGLVSALRNAPAPHWRDKSEPVVQPKFDGKTKVTICPTLVDMRFRTAPGERVEGAGFSALRMGQYIAPAQSAAARAVGA